MLLLFAEITFKNQQQLRKIQRTPLGSLCTWHATTYAVCNLSILFLVLQYSKNWNKTQHLRTHTERAEFKLLQHICISNLLQ
jgi:hypothetical protein